MVGTTAAVTGLNPGLQEAEILTILLPVLSYVGAICGVVYSLVYSSPALLVSWFMVD